MNWNNKEMKIQKTKMKNTIRISKYKKGWLEIVDALGKETE